MLRHFIFVHAHTHADTHAHQKFMFQDTKSISYILRQFYELLQDCAEKSRRRPAETQRSLPENLHFQRDFTSCNTARTFNLNKTKLTKMCFMKAFFDLEWLSTSLSDNGVTRAESSKVIFVILLEVVLPTERRFPDCLISHINHTLFIAITKAALQGNGP